MDVIKAGSLNKLKPKTHENYWYNICFTETKTTQEDHMILTVEQISKYHPDKVADQISDNILKIALQKNPHARVAVETMIKNQTVILAGEIGGVTLTEAETQQAVLEIMNGMNYKVKTITNLIDVQSKEIAGAVITDKTIKAGDQGIMIGYATKESPSFLPWGMHVANQIIERLDKMTEEELTQGDAKCQVSYDSQTLELKHVVISAYMSEYIDNLDQFRAVVKEHVEDLVPSYVITVNPAGAWYVGGPVADAGLTGRKIVADQYGPRIPVGGGAFSGKDLSKVDRSAAYALRNIAMDVLKTYDVEWVLIQTAYQIGYEDPVGLGVYSSHPESNEIIEKWIKKYYDLTPDAIIKKLALKPEDFPELAKGCHYRRGYVGSWNR